MVADRQVRLPESVVMMADQDIRTMLLYHEMNGGDASK
jgi:hypothetical protein